MSWAIPTAGQWHPGMAMTPDLNMGNYTPEQWAVIQQQNWQQWAQWQQQYAQWQSQYGEKYAQQMQAMQAMGGMPPLPTNAAPPPAPPPPDQPPPPPPHENNQPLYTNTTTTQPVPVPPPTQRNANTGYSSTSFTGNNQNWSQPSTDSQADLNLVAVNAEALKKLAEEERLFDIQFQKWEEEIEKWKRENVNHPDKDAYKEYEAKFEACRVQLLERRQQMNQRRARLLGNVPQASNTTTAGNINIPTNIPPPVQNISTQGFNQKSGQSHNYNTKASVNFSNQNILHNQHQQVKAVPTAASYNRSNNKNVDPQDRYESYQGMEDYSAHSSEKTSFLPATGSSGIPGLDLVPETDKNTSNNQDIIDITDEHGNHHKPAIQPDYSKISKGINNILGDEKIMNILSMVRGQNIPGGDNTQGFPIAGQSGPSGSGAGGGLNNFGGPYGGNMVNHNIPPNNQTMPPNNHNPQQNQWNRNDNQHNNQQYNNRQNMPFNRQGPHPMDQSSELQNRGYNNKVQEDGLQEQYYDRNTQYSGPNTDPRGIPPLMGTNMPPGRPPLIDMAGQQNRNNRGPHGNRTMFNNIGSHDNRGLQENNMSTTQPPKPKWVDEPLFSPSIIVEYEHKPLRLKARDFIEPVHTFDYDHKSKDDEYKKVDFESEIEEMFTRNPRRQDTEILGTERGVRYSRDPPYDYDRRPREELRERDDYRLRLPVPREEFDDRRRSDSAYFDRRRDVREREDRDNKYIRREDHFREKDRYRDRYDIPERSKSRDRDSRKRGRSRESELSDNYKKAKENEIKAVIAPKHIVMIDDILEPPGRDMRPEKIVIILRGPPGSGKSYLAKLIRDREAEHGGAARIMSIDDYFMQEGDVEEKDPATGKIVKKPTLKYEYDPKWEEAYNNSLKRAFKRSLTDGYFSFLIFDAVNDQLKGYADIWNFARQNGFQVYICTMELDPQICYKRNIHNRSLEDIELICSRFFKTPAHHIQLDATTLLQSAGITEVHMEDATDDVIMEDAETENDTFTSRWEKMDDAVQLARLDGTSKPLRSSQLSMEDYLQLDDWTPNKAKPGKKTVRWADLEERREQEKMRAIGFVVGQTDWNRMTDPTMGSSALTQTKYIERVRRN